MASMPVYQVPQENNYINMHRMKNVLLVVYQKFHCLVQL